MPSLASAKLMLMGRMSGLLFGTLGGLLMDITTGTLGTMTFFFMFVGFMIGLIVLLWAGPLSYVLTFLSRGALYGIYQFSTLPFQLFGQSTVPFNALF